MPREIGDPVTRPADYAELFDVYYDYVVGLVRKAGIYPEEAPDVASEILLRFQERDFLSKYEPDYEFDTVVGRKRARFKSFLNAFVLSYVQHHRDRQATRARREVLICDSMVAGVDGSSTQWIEVFGAHSEMDLTGVEHNDLVVRVRAHLVQVPQRSSRDVRDLPRLFDLVVEQVQCLGRVDRQALALVFGVSDTAVSSWFQAMRAEVRCYLDGEPPGTSMGRPVTP